MSSKAMAAVARRMAYESERDLGKYPPRSRHHHKEAETVSCKAPCRPKGFSKGVPRGATSQSSTQGELLSRRLHPPPPPKDAHGKRTRRHKAKYRDVPPSLASIPGQPTWERQKARSNVKRPHITTLMVIEPTRKLLRFVLACRARRA